MKKARLAIAVAVVCAGSTLLTACDVKKLLPGAAAAESHAAPAHGLQHEGHLLIVPEASPLRHSLQVDAVRQQALAQGIDAPGVIEALPEKLVKVTPPLAGRIVKLHRTLGDAVKAGDALFTLDSSDLGTVYNEHAKAQSALLQARREFERQKALFDGDISARKDYEAAQLALAAAENDARASAGRLAQLGVVADASSHREYVLRSPIAGRVVDMAGAQGGYWNDITAPIMTVADLSTVWLSASVPEKEMAQVFPGQKARITLNAYADQPVEGQVKYVGDLLDTETRTVKVRVAIDNRDGRIKPGMFARVSFAGVSRPTLVVPAAAVLQSGLYTRVFVEKTPFHFESRVVNVGASVPGNGVEVLAGLAAGERIVVKDGVLLND